MKYLLCILLIAVIFGALRTHREVRKSKTERERVFAIRTAAASALFVVVFGSLLLFLPNKARVLMLLPAFCVGVALAKAWHSTRTRLRREAAAEMDFERMKRVG